jgi:hypothetical protein
MRVSKSYRMNEHTGVEDEKKTTLVCKAAISDASKVVLLVVVVVVYRVGSWRVNF